ncbi:TIGR00730 family Rossman fold protein [Xylocopilactobacillus apicola]|uniref:Cytokinin riboside 5'-monophosphate phosphoribohydrolase n=1 Tax=Xylocopilactobacillus apicola TaxID=2932184 RepID=A0AAU9DM61_9LACO|nr:TIGR00730 family Rossman fold protein [Xylocopilactobacillus apicola]BDR59671.1 cytokinin riboside 5'-monophosphate phosphoribohydrolase [Xylocopilactobacillus apicola]
MTNFAVYCSASPESTKFNPAGEQIADFIAGHQGNLVYGGSNAGLMHVTAQNVHKRGGKIIGVIPKFMADENLVSPLNDQTYVVDTMDERKAKMAELADVCVALPGGVGTLEEITEIMSWDRIGEIQIPYFFYNYEHFFDPFEKFIDQLVTDDLLSAKDRTRIHFITDLNEANQYLNDYQPTNFHLFSKENDQ